MSHSYRQPFPGTRPLVSGNMVPTLGINDPTLPGNMPNAAAFGYAAVPQQPVLMRPYYVPQGMVPHVPPTMYMPYVEAATTQTRPLSNDPARSHEERKKLERERNFQLQQQRLKQFTIAGKKGSVNADSLIDSMFGKIPPNKNSFGYSSEANAKLEVRASTTSSTSQSPNFFEAIAEPRVVNGSNQNYAPVDLSTSCKTEPSKDRKELDTMMFECSNLGGPSKAKTFHKPSVKELPRSSHHAANFASSEKARDWRNVSELNNVFTLPKQSYPSWCCKQQVPELYLQVEAFATQNGRHGVDNNLLLPVLISSGLSQEVLGQIWDLVNKTDPNHLTTTEMYAALALIALAQSGLPITNMDILHSLPSCPCPQLPNFIKCLEQAQMKADAQNKLHETNQVPTPLEEQFESVSANPNSTHKVVRPTAIALSKIKAPSQPSGDPSSFTGPLENQVQSWAPFECSGFTSSPDDDFDEFKSATPTAVNVAIPTPTEPTKDDDDDFDDFKQAPLVTSSQVTTKKQTAKIISNRCEQDLMSPEEDKYSVFRLLQHHEDTTDFGDFSSNTSHSQDVTSTEIEHASSFVPPDNPVSFEDTAPMSGLFAKCKKTLNASQGDDEFGDFFQADVSATPLPSISINQNSFAPDFANFGNHNSCFDVQNESVNFQQISNSGPPSANVDDDFGDFACSVPVTYKAELGQEFLFHPAKDNISLAESQSVSSLELGIFDNGGQNGETKSSLSRQGSIPSLDLKVAGVENVDDGFGEMQSCVPSKSPSPSNDLKTREEKNVYNTLNSFPFQPSSTVPFADKYSVIRSEQIREDQHISEWLRCLQSCLNILENTKKIFNQMSCSSVCNEVINTEEGENYVKNVTEVYKVVCRISLASKSVGKQTEKLLQLIKKAELAWTTLGGFFSGSSVMVQFFYPSKTQPGDSALDFSSGVLRPNSDNNLKACGLCLLNVDSRSKAFDKSEDTQKLSYGGRNYHSTCANLWVNCVDPLLPALTLPLFL